MGVAYIPGSNFYTTPTHNHIRLNYSHPSIDDIVEGIKILGGLLKEQLTNVYYSLSFLYIF